MSPAEEALAVLVKVLGASLEPGDAKKWLVVNAPLTKHRLFGELSEGDYATLQAAWPKEMA